MVKYNVESSPPKEKSKGFSTRLNKGLVGAGKRLEQAGRKKVISRRILKKGLKEES